LKGEGGVRVNAAAAQLFEKQRKTQ